MARGPGASNDGKKLPACELILRTGRYRGRGYDRARVVEEACFRRLGIGGLRLQRSRLAAVCVLGPLSFKLGPAWVVYIGVPFHVRLGGCWGRYN